MQQLQFVVITPLELRNDIKQDVISILEGFKNSFTPLPPDEFLTRAETAKMLKITFSTLYKWTKKGYLKSFGISGKVYYKRSQIEEALIALQ